MKYYVRKWELVACWELVDMKIMNFLSPLKTLKLLTKQTT